MVKVTAIRRAAVVHFRVRAREFAPLSSLHLIRYDNVCLQICSECWEEEALCFCWFSWQPCWWRGQAKTNTREISDNLRFSSNRDPVHRPRVNSSRVIWFLNSQASVALHPRASDLRLQLWTKKKRKRNSKRIPLFPLRRLRRNNSKSYTSDSLTLHRNK